MGKHVTRDLGKVLRRAREERELSLREVSRRSQGRFTPSGIAGYERGERRISVERMCALSELYGMPPERLLADALHPTGAAPPVQIDLSALENLPSELRNLLAGYIEEVLTMRGPADPDRISLRSGDLEILAGSASGSVAELYRRMRDSLAENAGGSEPQTASPDLATPEPFS